ncbi:uncharacterized protein LOC110835075 isoform X2 [Zootermopsis nevadensis]|uniref:uncharacterized protein LOC110835075 isoform X2 n=1 Tax=Zootermopsis nevadensis TaxID=136037 RepID=UPI000B8EC4BE|nr:uncharacterized protein LOC110835075 isoform X2 [Zootermopsis nevadensis]
MGTENELNADVNNIMTDFYKIKEVDEISCGENIRLSEHMKQLEASLADLKRQLADEKEKWHTNQEKMKLSQNHEMEELKSSCEKRVMEAEREVEVIKAKFHAQCSELAKKLENIQNQNSNEINIIVLEYEERLHKMEERLKAAEAESQQIRDRAATDVVLYQKKVLAMEQQYNNMIQEKEILPPPFSPLPPNSSESFKPGTRRRRNNPFQYHIPSSVNQSQPSIIPLHSILKKTSVYDSAQSSSDKENILPSLDDFADSENVGTGDGKPVEYSTLNICAKASSTSFMTSVSTNSFVDNSSVATRNSIMPHLQFVTEPADLDTIANGPLKQESNQSLEGKKRRFVPAKKRKLFCCNAKDTL